MIDHITCIFIICFYLVVNGTCGMGIMVPSNNGEIKLDGKTIRNKPTDAVTVALWVNLTTVEGRHSLFETVGGHSLHTKNQYDLSITDGAVRWMHRNEYDQIVFQVDTGPLILAGKYNGYTNATYTWSCTCCTHAVHMVMHMLYTWSCTCYTHAHARVVHMVMHMLYTGYGHAHVRYMLWTISAT